MFLLRDRKRFATYRLLGCNSEEEICLETGELGHWKILSGKETLVEKPRLTENHDRLSWQGFSWSQGFPQYKSAA